MSTRSRRLATCIAGLALACVPCGCTKGARDGGPVESDIVTVAQSMLGPVSASLTMEPKEPRFGDRIRFVFEVAAAQGTTLEEPTFGARLGHFRIRGRKDEGDPARGKLRSVITAEAERTGTNIGRLPPILFRVASGEGAGSDQQLVVPAFQVEIAGLTPDQQPKLADLGAPLPPVALPVQLDDSGRLWILGGAGLLVLALGAWWWRRRHSPLAGLPVEVDPAVEAAHAFDALVAARLVEQGRFAEFYVRLTGIVRRFIERTTGIHAPEQTTEEFLRAMDGSPAIPPARRSELSAFLAAADLVKYAAQIPSAAEVAEGLQAARRFCAARSESGEAAA